MSIRSFRHALSGIILLYSTKSRAQQAIWPSNGNIFDRKIHRIDIFLTTDSWTKIFGLGFSTFLTLVLVPAMYLSNEKIKVKVLDGSEKITIRIKHIP